jgi:hypothetical protein
MSIYKKIHAVMNDVNYLQKDDKVSFGNTSYKAISEEKVTGTIRAALVKHGLVIVPTEQEHSKEGNLSTVNVKYQITDIDTGEFIVAVSSGTGVDTQDKGVGKAMTYAYKYLLLRTFAIPTGDDPDKVSSEELDAKFKQQAIKQQAKAQEVASNGLLQQSDIPSTGQQKMISEKALRAGYTKNDKQLLFDDLSEFLARKIHGLIEVKKEEVEAVIQYLDKKIKDA